MTADEVLAFCRQAGVVLAADGDQLQWSAPRGTMTLEIRAALTAHKLAILASLRAPFVTLLCGLTLPLSAVLLTLDLEARGFTLELDADHRLIVRESDRLTADDRAALSRWHRHVAAAVQHATCADVPQ